MIKNFSAEATYFFKSAFVIKNTHFTSLSYQLNFLLGRFSQPVARGTSIREQTLPNKIEVGFPTDMLRLRPDIQQAEYNLIATGAEVEAVRAAFFPSLTLSPYLGFNALSAATFITPEAIAIGALGALSAPLFNMNRIRANYKRSQAQQMEAYYNYQKTVLTGYQEVISSLKCIENYEKMYTLKEEEVDVLLSAVTTSNDLFMAGYASYLEVITAQESVLEAELGLISARKEIFLSIINLYRGLGGGWK